MHRHQSGACGLFAAIAAALVLGGCGAKGPPKGQVTGKVLAAGQPVTAGGVMFAPMGEIAARPATGTIQEDGTFTLGTAGPTDGAAVGKHLVTYNPPPRTGQEEWDGYGTPPPQKISPYEGMVPKTPEVEVKAGPNEITIELVRGPPEYVE